MWINLAPVEGKLAGMQGAPQPFHAYTTSKTILDRVCRSKPSHHYCLTGGLALLQMWINLAPVEGKLAGMQGVPQPFHAYSTSKTKLDKVCRSQPGHYYCVFGGIA